MIPMPSKPDGRQLVGLRPRSAAPTTPPHSVPIPPRTVIRTTSPEVVQCSSRQRDEAMADGEHSAGQSREPGGEDEGDQLVALDVVARELGRAGALSRIATSTLPNGECTIRQAAHIPNRMIGRAA